MTNRKAGIMIIERAIRQSQQTNQRMIPFFLLYTDFFRFFYLSFFSPFLYLTKLYIQKKLSVVRARARFCIRLYTCNMRVYAGVYVMGINVITYIYVACISPVYERVARNLFIIYYYACIRICVCTRVCMCINVSINRNWRMN